MASTGPAVPTEGRRSFVASLDAVAVLQLRIWDLVFGCFLCCGLLEDVS